MAEMNICNGCSNLETFDKLDGNCSMFCAYKADDMKTRVWNMISNSFDLKNKDCIAPDWCPLYKKNKFSPKFRDRNTILEKLKSLKPRTKFNEFEKNTIYHIPPYLDKKRVDVVVTEVNSYFIRVKILPNGETKVFLPTDVESLLMVKSRIKKMIKK